MTDLFKASQLPDGKYIVLGYREYYVRGQKKVFAAADDDLLTAIAKLMAEEAKHDPVEIYT